MEGKIGQRDGGHGEGARDGGLAFYGGWQGRVDG